MNRTRRILSALGFALAVATTASGCLVTASGHARFRSGAVVVYDEPPAPRYEQVSTRSGYVFIRGHWEWQNGQWQWVNGYWEAQRTGYVWADGYWERRGNSWHWIDGRWTAGGSVAVDNGGYQNQEQRTVIVRDNRPQPPPGERTQVIDHREQSQYPTQPPPPVRSETPGARSGYVWITGRWDWRQGNWEWIPGHWERARAQAVWQPGRWELQGNYYIWIEGRWSN